MIIPLSDKLRIRGTESAYQLERPHKRKGQIKWEPFKYYSTFGPALAAACGREIRTHPAQGLTEAIEAATAIAARYGKLLDCALDEIAKRSEPSLRAVS
jgi:hypothetical protein